MTTRQGASGPLVEWFEQFSMSEGFSDETTEQKEYLAPVAGSEADPLTTADNILVNGVRVPARGAVRELALRQIQLGATPQSLDITYSVKVIRADDLVTLVDTGIAITIKSDDTDEAKSRLTLGFAVSEGDFVLLEADHPSFAADGAPQVVKFTVSAVQTQVA